MYPNHTFRCGFRTVLQQYNLYYISCNGSYQLHNRSGWYISLFRCFPRFNSTFSLKDAARSVTQDTVVSQRLSYKSKQYQLSQ